jgi:hypothetical protein
MGIERTTIHRRFQEAGISTACPLFSDIDDDALDELVAEISLTHPFVGSKIVAGHLATRHPPSSSSGLRRVDEMGMLVRFVFSKSILIL